MLLQIFKYSLHLCIHSQGIAAQLATFSIGVKEAGNPCNLCRTYFNDIQHVRQESSAEFILFLAQQLLTEVHKCHHAICHILYSSTPLLFSCTCSRSSLLYSTQFQAKLKAGACGYWQRGLMASHCSAPQCFGFTLRLYVR